MLSPAPLWLRGYSILVAVETFFVRNPVLLAHTIKNQ